GQARGVGLRGQPIEGVVDLDGVEVLRVVGEPVTLWHRLRIEDPTPVGVDPPRAADVHRPRRHGTLAQLPSGRWSTRTAMPSRGLPRVGMVRFARCPARCRWSVSGWEELIAAITG